jgi:hypothetical protein
MRAIAIHHLTPLSQLILSNSIGKIAESYADCWRFYSFKKRTDYYRIFSRICKPLLISLARLFFTIFRNFIKVTNAWLSWCSYGVSDHNFLQGTRHNSDAFKSCMRELSMIQKSFSELSTSTLFDFGIITGISGVELGIPDGPVDGLSYPVMYKLCEADHGRGRSPSPFEPVRMPDFIIESADLVFDQIGPGSVNPEDLAAASNDPRHISILRGMGFRRDLFKFLASNCDDNTFEIMTHIASVPLAFRDETTFFDEKKNKFSLLNLDDARSMRKCLPIAPHLIREAANSDKVLHAAFLSACTQKFEALTHQRASLSHGDLLDFVKALRNVVSLASDSSSSTFFELCVGGPGERSIFTCCVSLAQACVIKSASDQEFGTIYATIAFVLMSVVIAIAKKQKTGPDDRPQIHRDREVRFSALEQLSNIDAFNHDAFNLAVSEVKPSESCRFVASWLLANKGQCFQLFRQNTEIFSSLVPLNSGRLLRECVAFVRQEAFQNYVPSACYLWVCNQPTFAKEFGKMFPSQQGAYAHIPQCISPFPDPLTAPAELGGSIVSALFSSDRSGCIDQESAASVLSSIIFSDSEASAMSVSLIGSVLSRIKSGANSTGSLLAIKTLLPIMEHAGLHGQANPSGGIDGGWYNESGFFMRLLHGAQQNVVYREQTASLASLSVSELLASLNRGALGSKARAGHINAIFTNFILLTRGINASQSMWRLENPELRTMCDQMLQHVTELQDGQVGPSDHLLNYIQVVFDALGAIYRSEEDRAHLIFSLTEMISIAAALLLSQNFAWRRPLNVKETDKFLSGILPYLEHFNSEDLAESVAKAIFAVISPEVYVACLDNASAFDSYVRNLFQAKLQEPMKRRVGIAFDSALSTMKQLTHTHASVAARVIRLYFDSLCSMFDFCKSNRRLFWCNLLAAGKLTNPSRLSIFESEVWPKPDVQQNSSKNSFKFHLDDVENVLKVFSEGQRISQFWRDVIEIQDVFSHGDSFSKRLSVFKPVHQAIAHAITFHADTLLNNTFSIRYHNPSKDRVVKGNEDARLAAGAAVEASYLQLQQLCGILIPPEHNGNIPEKMWLLALPVLREILLQQTSFLSCASSMFLGQPILLDGHLVAASHVPWINGKVEPIARMISRTPYDDHSLFAMDSPGTDSALGKRNSNYHLTTEHPFAASLSIVTATAFDFLGQRQSFLTWLHQVASFVQSRFAPTHHAMQPVAAASAPQTAASSLPALQPGTIRVGSRVRIHGLKHENSVQFNGRAGFVGEFDEQVSRWKIKIASNSSCPGDTVIRKFSPANLILLDSFSPDFASRLQAELAADVLGLLPFQPNIEFPDSTWSDVHSLGHLEFDLYCLIDQRWGMQFHKSITDIRQKYVDPPLDRIEEQISHQTFRMYRSLRRSHLLDGEGVESRINHFQTRFRGWLQTWPSDQLMPPHTRCQILGSFFRIAALENSLTQLSQVPAQIDSEFLASLCKKFCDWFAQAQLHKCDMLDRSKDPNTFASVITAGLEAIRSALHCLMMLPSPLLHLREALVALLPRMQELSNEYKDLIEVVVSSIIRPTRGCLETFQKGSIVHVHGLTSESAVCMNGKKGLIFRDFQDDQRWPVEVTVSDGVSIVAALRPGNMVPQNMRFEFLSLVMLRADGAFSEAFQVVLNCPPLFMKVCNWLMAHHEHASCSRMLIQLVSQQNFPKVVDISQPRSIITGLHNRGNTCFIASLYQQLASTPKFVSALQCAVFGPEGRRLSMSNASKTNFLKDFLSKISNQNTALTEEEVEQHYRRLGFSLPVQQDTPFAVLYQMLSCIIAETSDYDHFRHGDAAQMTQNASDSTVLANTLVSKLIKQVSWRDGETPHCTRTSEPPATHFESIDTATVDTDTQSTESMRSIEEVLRAYFIDRATEDGPITRFETLEFEKLPEVLVLGLNPCGNRLLTTGTLPKYPRVPSISKELDLRNCARLTSSAAARNTMYELTGIILHHGDTVFGGHYTSLVRAADSTWTHINDLDCTTVSPIDMSTILQRDGNELPKVTGALGVHLTGKPYGLFYSLKCVSHPCAAILFDPRLVDCMAVFARSSPSQSPVVSDTLSLCFKLAPLFANDPERSRSFAAVCHQLLTASAPHSLDATRLLFQQMACSEDPELLLALCKLRDSGSGHQGWETILNGYLVMKLVDNLMTGSSRAIYRRLKSAFEIAAPLTAECHLELCQRVSGSVAASLSSAQAAAARQDLVSTKVYAVLKCIADISFRSSPFLPYFSESQNPQFAEAVVSIAQSLPAESAQGESNLYDFNVFFPFPAFVPKC